MLGIISKDTWLKKREMLNKARQSFNNYSGNYLNTFGRCREEKIPRACDRRPSAGASEEPSWRKSCLGQSGSCLSVVPIFKVTDY